MKTKEICTRQTGIQIPWSHVQSENKEYCHKWRSTLHLRFVTRFFGPVTPENGKPRQSDFSITDARQQICFNQRDSIIWEHIAIVVVVGCSYFVNHLSFENTK